jgi:hypothetical protein
MESHQNMLTTGKLIALAIAAVIVIALANEALVALASRSAG